MDDKSRLLLVSINGSAMFQVEDLRLRVETYPVRTISNVYEKGFQSANGDQVKKGTEDNA